MAKLVEWPFVLSKGQEPFFRSHPRTRDTRFEVGPASDSLHKSETCDKRSLISRQHCIPYLNRRADIRQTVVSGAVGLNAELDGVCDHIGRIL